MKTRGKNFFFTSDFYGARNVLADSFDRLQLELKVKSISKIGRKFVDFQQVLKALDDGFFETNFQKSLLPEVILWYLNDWTLFGFFRGIISTRRTAAADKIRNQRRQHFMFVKVYPNYMKDYFQNSKAKGTFYTNLKEVQFIYLIGKKFHPLWH